eukprot:11127686-Heterocapsa_arctica.AAC.1
MLGFAIRNNTTSSRKFTNLIVIGFKAIETAALASAAAAGSAISTELHSAALASAVAAAAAVST